MVPTGLCLIRLSDRIRTRRMFLRMLMGRIEGVIIGELVVLAMAM